MASSQPSAALAPPRLGSETPRIWTPPRRELTPQTTAGYEAVEFAESVLDIRLLPWQRWLLIHALELNDDGTFRFRTLLLLVARQNGKTTWLQVLSLWRMFVDNAALIIGTAQNLDMAEEAWTGAVDMAEGVPELAAEIAAVDRTNGKKALRLETGERYKVAAASRRGGRGLSGDLAMLDELREHQTWEAWGAVTKTTMARPRPQIVGASNAGDASSIVLATLRQKAIAADGHGSIGIFEWSAPDGCDLDDRDAWAQANPSMGPASLGYTITEDAIASALETDPEPVFRTEVLCQWVGSLVDKKISPAAWAACRDPHSRFGDGAAAIGIQITGDQQTAYLGAVGLRPDKLLHAELVGECKPHNVVETVLRLSQRRSLSVVIDPGSFANSLIKPLRDAGVTVVDDVTLQKITVACGSLYNAVADLSIRHIGQVPLDIAIDNSTVRVTARDAWTWKGPAVSPLMAITLALHGFGLVEDYDVSDSFW